MTWEEHQKINHFIIEMAINQSNREKTDIECPKCGKQVYRRLDLVLTSNPPKTQYECDCGWVGYSHC